MNYFNHYDKLIEKAKNRHLEEYTEKHHIIPKCLGGEDRQSNLVSLTPEEHYVAHQLLVKMFPDEYLLVYALSKMTQGRPNNKRYGWVKRKWQEISKQRVGRKNGSYGKYWYYNPETLESSKFSPENIPKGWIKGRIISKNRKQCSNCGKIIGFETTTHAIYCSSECRGFKVKESYNKKTESSFRKIEKIAKNFQLEKKNIYKNKDFIKQCFKQRISIRQILFFLNLNDSGENYRRVKEVIF